MKIKIWFILAVVAIITLQLLSTAKVYRDNRRLSDNFKAVMSGVQFGYTLDSLHTARTEKMLLDISEIKSDFPGIVKSVNDLNVKMRQLERYSAVSSTASYQIASRLHDTTQVRQTIIKERIVRDTVKMQYIRYRDRWIDFQQAIVADSAYTAIQTRDSIAIVQSWERAHQFWFLKWGRKRHIQAVTNANPHAKIIYSIYVEKN